MPITGTGVPTNRSNIDLPNEVSNLILQNMQEQSVIMRLAQQINLPGRGVQIPVITGDPEPQWVAETYTKPIGEPGLDKKIMQAHKLAVIEIFSNEFRRDASALYNALVDRLPGVLAKAFDRQVFFGASNLANFDSLTNVTGVMLDGQDGVYSALVAGDTVIAEAGGITNGFVFSPQGKGMLLGALDDNGRPIFINSVSDEAIPRILGAPTYISQAAYMSFPSAKKDVVGFAGDWSHAMYGTVEGVRIDYSSDAALQTGEGTYLSMFQQNMFAVRAEIEVGFVCENQYFARFERSNS